MRKLLQKILNSDNVNRENAIHDAMNQAGLSNDGKELKRCPKCGIVLIGGTLCSNCLKEYK